MQYGATQTPNPTRSGSLTLAAGLVGLSLGSAPGAAGLVNHFVNDRLKSFLVAVKRFVRTVVSPGLYGWAGNRICLDGALGLRFPQSLESIRAGRSPALDCQSGCLHIIGIGRDRIGVCAATDRHFVGSSPIVVYPVSATTVLAVPCLLMGATMPLAAETCQRNLGLSNSRLSSACYSL